MPQPTEEFAALTAQLDHLNQELSLIREIWEELRTDLSWAVWNGRIVISLAESQGEPHVADATVDSNLIELTVRLQAALATIHADIATAIDSQPAVGAAASDINRSCPQPATAGASGRTQQERIGANQPAIHTTRGNVQRSLFESERQSGADSLPAITLFEIGEIVEFLYDRPGQQGEVIALDDACNTATVRLDSGIELNVIQESLKRVGRSI